MNKSDKRYYSMNPKVLKKYQKSSKLSIYLFIINEGKDVIIPFKQRICFIKT